MTPKDRFLRACRRQPVDRPPVWMMRQAGRYLPEYRALRAKHPTLEMMQTPALAAEITLQPLARLGVDAAILYSDILILPDAMGLPLEFREGEGPVFLGGIRDEDDVKRLSLERIRAEAAFVPEAIRLIKDRLPADFPLLGFAGAPWTVASYMIGARGATDCADLKRMMHQQPAVLTSLLSKLTDATIAYLRMQIEAGVDAVQLFDTWAGILSPTDYQQWALPPVRTIVREMKAQGVPTILYIKGGSHLFDEMLTSGVDVLSLDWRMRPSEARRRAGDRVALQGNFDPTALYADPETIARLTTEMVAEFGSTGYIANLGHGILPDIPVAHAQAFIDAVKRSC